MRKSDVTYLVCSVFSAMVAFFYCCTMWFSIVSNKLPRYYPLEHAWKWGKEKGVPSQGWYGMQAFAYLAAGTVTLVVYLVLRRSVFAEPTLKPAMTKALGAAVTAIVIVCMGYMLYHEFDKWGIF